MILDKLDERGVVCLTCTDEYQPFSGAVGLNVHLDISSFDQLGVFAPRMVRPSGGLTNACQDIHVVERF